VISARGNTATARRKSAPARREGHLEGAHLVEMIVVEPGEPLDLAAAAADTARAALTAA
jgi:hypothetical protein